MGEMAMPGPPPKLEEMVLIVTGAAQGIGQAIAAEAVASGVGHLLLTDIEADGLEKTANTLSRTSRVEIVVEDLADASSPRRIAERAKAVFGRIDGLVNAAGITTRGGFSDATPELWDRLFAVNARAAFLLMQQVIDDLLTRNAPGSIVNIQSTNAHCGAADLSVYAATKGALQTLTKNAANAYLHQGIRVNGINLGWTLTPSEDRLQTKLIGPDWAEKEGRSLPLGRLLLPEDAARHAVFLLGPGSAPMTGVSVELSQAVLGAP